METATRKHDLITSTPFAISVYQESWSDHAAHADDLISHILERERTEPSVVRSNQGGYQTQPTLGNEELFRPLLEFIAITAEPVLRSYDLDFKNILLDAAWANINRGQGSHNHAHIHDGILSGVYYLQAPEGSGKLNIINPNMNVLWQGHQQALQKNQHTAESCHIVPQAGVLFLWPSYVPHSVDANSREDCERISISFNITVAQ